MGTWWITAGSVLVIAAGLVGAIAWQIAREVDRLTASVVTLRATRADVRALAGRRTSQVSNRWTFTDPHPR
jgi:hypothetical protein